MPEIKEIKKGYPRGGWKPLPLMEKKVMVYGHVKAKHWNEAMKEIKKVIQKFR